MAGTIRCQVPGLEGVIELLPRDLYGDLTIFCAIVYDICRVARLLLHAVRPI